MGSSWPEYLAWNHAIANEFFSARLRGLPVYLDVETDILRRLANGLAGPGVPGDVALREAVLGTLNLPPTPGRPVFEQHVTRLDYWRAGSREDPPPSIALLALLSLIAGSMVADSQFRANNYYGRCCEILGIKGEEGKRRLQHDFMRQSHAFWDALNAWLDDADGQRGVPTAYAFDARRHVGIPISQALVRESDRRRFASAFMYFGLQPGQRLSLPDMLELLRDWLPRAVTSPSLKRLWNQKEARERIAEVACRELEAWKGEEAPSAGHARESRILLAGLIRDHPPARVDLGLVVLERAGLPRAGYRLEQRASEQARAAIADCAQPIALTALERDGFLSFADGSRISLPDALLGNLVLETTGNDVATLRRLMRRVIPMKFDEAERFYCEAGRVELGERYLVLAHESLADRTESALSAIACSGFKRLTSPSLRGLPGGWTVFRDVLVMSSREISDPDLGVLEPMATLQVALGGGLVLPVRGTWHSSLPPEIRAASPGGKELQISLLETQVLDGSRKPIRLELGGVGPSRIFSLDQALPDGDYRVFLKEGDLNAHSVVLATVPFRLRSADSARSIGPQPTSWVGHPIGDLNGHAAALTRVHDPLSATESEHDQIPAISLRGARLEGRLVVPASALLAQEPRLGKELRAESLGYRSGLQGTEKGIVARTAAPPCIQGGVHHWLCPPAVPGRTLARQGHCRNCGLEQSFPRLRGSRPIAADLGTNTTGVPHARTFRKGRNPEPPTFAAPPGRSVVTADQLFDALNFARSGSWAAFARLADQMNDERWFARELCLTLSALGHIDVTLDRMQPKAWAISPGTIVWLGHRGAFLAGTRYRRLVERLTADVETLGGRVTLEAQEEAPSIVRIDGLRLSDLRDVAKSTGTHLGQRVELSVEPGPTIAALLPPLDSVLACLRVVTLPTRVDTEVYNPATGRWMASEYPDGPGAYRFHTEPLIYVYASPNEVSSGVGRLGDARLVKYLSAGQHRVSLIAYDPEARCLLAQLGARLPGLYERAAVLCSGCAPRREGGIVRYGGVPPTVAAMLAERLGVA